MCAHLIQDYGAGSDPQGRPGDRPRHPPARSGPGPEVRTLLDTGDLGLWTDHPRMRVERTDPARRCDRVLMLHVDSRERDFVRYPSANRFTLRPNLARGSALKHLTLVAARIPNIAGHLCAVVCVRGVSGVVFQSIEAQGALPDSALAVVPLDPPPAPVRWWNNVPGTDACRNRWMTASHVPKHASGLSQLCIELYGSNGNLYPLPNEVPVPPPPPWVPDIANNVVLEFEIVTGTAEGDDSDDDGE
jgi:hypothetical protein